MTIMCCNLRSLIALLFLLLIGGDSVFSVWPATSARHGDELLRNLQYQCYRWLLVRGGYSRRELEEELGIPSRLIRFHLGGGMIETGCLVVARLLEVGHHESESFEPGTAGIGAFKLTLNAARKIAWMWGDKGLLVDDFAWDRMLNTRIPQAWAPGVSQLTFEDLLMQTVLATPDQSRYSDRNASSSQVIAQLSMLCTLRLKNAREGRSFPFFSSEHNLKRFFVAPRYVPSTMKEEISPAYMDELYDVWSLQRKNFGQVELLPQEWLDFKWYIYALFFAKADLSLKRLAKTGLYLNGRRYVPMTNVSSIRNMVLDFFPNSQLKDQCFERGRIFEFLDPIYEESAKIAREAADAPPKPLSPLLNHRHRMLTVKSPRPVGWRDEIRNLALEIKKILRQSFNPVRDLEILGQSFRDSEQKRVIGKSLVQHASRMQFHHSLDLSDILSHCRGPCQPLAIDLLMKNFPDLFSYSELLGMIRDRNVYSLLFDDPLLLANWIKQANGSASESLGTSFFFGSDQVWRCLTIYFKASYMDYILAHYPSVLFDWLFNKFTVLMQDMLPVASAWFLRNPLFHEKIPKLVLEPMVIPPVTLHFAGLTGFSLLTKGLVAFPHRHREVVEAFDTVLKKHLPGSLRSLWENPEALLELLMGVNGNQRVILWALSHNESLAAFKFLLENNPNPILYYLLSMNTVFHFDLMALKNLFWLYQQFTGMNNLPIPSSWFQVLSQFVAAPMLQGDSTMHEEDENDLANPGGSSMTGVPLASSSQLQLMEWIFANCDREAFKETFSELDSYFKEVFGNESMHANADLRGLLNFYLGNVELKQGPMIETCHQLNLQNRVDQGYYFNSTLEALPLSTCFIMYRFYRAYQPIINQLFRTSMMPVEDPRSSPESLPVELRIHIAQMNEDWTVSGFPAPVKYRLFWRVFQSRRNFTRFLESSEAEIQLLHQS